MIERVEDLATLAHAAGLRRVDPPDGGPATRWHGSAPDGSPAHFKRLVPRPAIGAPPNVVAELLAPSILAAAGIAHLRAVAVHVMAEGWWLVRTPLLPAASWRPALLATAGERAAVPDDTLIDLLVADVVIGNGDRHLANLMIGRGSSRGCAVPVDHELALLDPRDARIASDHHHLVAGLGGWAGDATDSYGVRRHARLGTLAGIVAANPWYRVLLERIPRERAPRERVRRAATRLCGVAYDTLLGCVPDEVLGERPAVRRARLVDLLRRRSDAIAACLPAARCG